MEKWEGAVVVVTGASSGLGLVVCQKLVEKGLKVREPTEFKNN